MYLNINNSIFLKNEYTCKFELLTFYAFSQQGRVVTYILRKGPNYEFAPVIALSNIVLI